MKGTAGYPEFDLDWLRYMGTVIHRVSFRGHPENQYLVCHGTWTAEDPTLIPRVLQLQTRFRPLSA